MFTTRSWVWDGVGAIDQDEFLALFEDYVEGNEYEGLRLAARNGIEQLSAAMAKLEVDIKETCEELAATNP